MTRLAAVICLALGCTACSKPHAPQPEQTPSPQARTATPWDDMKAQERKAAQVSDTVQKQADDQRKAVDAAEQ